MRAALAARWRATAGWRRPRVLTRLGIGLVVLAVAVAGIGRRELFRLGAEDPARSIRRSLLEPADVDVAPGLPWAQVPAWLPGPADGWAGGSTHAVVMRLEAPGSRALRLDIQTGRGRPAELLAFPAPPADSQARLRVVVNDVRIATFELPGMPPARRPPRLRTVIPAGVRGDGRLLTIALVNEAGPGVRLERVRLIEVWPSLVLSQLGRGGRFPPVSAALLAVGLGCLLGARLQDPRRESSPRRWRRALGPALGLLLLGVATAALPAVSDVPSGAWLLLILLVLLIGRSDGRPVGPRSLGRAITRAVGTGLLTLVALTVSVVAGELALRVAFGNEHWARMALRPPAARPPGRDVTRRNSFGFEEREFPIEKPPGVYRIAILGDSLSISAPRRQRFGNVIADRLNAGGPRSVTYEAVSFGQTGADTTHQTRILQRHVWRTHPDFVLLEWYVNDLENGDHSQRPEWMPLIPDQRLRHVVPPSLLHRMLEEHFNRVREGLGFVETYPAYMHRFFSDRANPHWESAAVELRLLVDECRTHQTPLAIALFPHLSPGLTTGAYEYAELHDNVLALCREMAVPCVDLRSVFVGRRDYMSYWVTRFDAHPNGLAHRLMAERLVEVFGPLWLEAGRVQGGGAAAR